ncbi:hypothetical protein CGCS363_v006473 [Colletotrichum siamense]|uniref:uncharacterized protein n=1 Tax=Colletotrichum siamense TaxID=690259 RepID=UPI0018724924|nr:uncharacterized protein CGCS363_v006473 [Colletotrichum siamense]KAF5501768.1 hypothetical protein CGCS363_v006473 [Colletotrichum siamense]
MGAHLALHDIHPVPYFVQMGSCVLVCIDFGRRSAAGSQICLNGEERKRRKLWRLESWIRDLGNELARRSWYLCNCWIRYGPFDEAADIESRGGCLLCSAPAPSPTARRTGGGWSRRLKKRRKGTAHLAMDDEASGTW